MEKFPSHDFHLTVGKFTEDTGDTGAPSGEISGLFKIYMEMGKVLLFHIWCDSVEVRAAPFKSGGQ